MLYVALPGSSYQELFMVTKAVNRVTSSCSILYPASRIARP